LTPIAELPQRRCRSVIFDRGYPSFPLKEIAVCRTVYRESTKKDLDIVHFRPPSQARLQAAQGVSPQHRSTRHGQKSLNNINNL
jgi:hypothetical protein